MNRCHNLNNTNMQESDSIPLLELDTLDILELDTSPINFNSLHKNIDDNEPKSPSMLSITPYRRKRRKQSRLAFYSVKNNEKMELSSSVDKHKAANILHNVEQNFIQDVSKANATANAIVTENSATTLMNNSSEIFDEDVIEVTPTKISVASKLRQFLELKRKIPKKRIDFGSCSLLKHTSMQMENVNTLKDKVNIDYLSPIKVNNKTDIQIKKSIKVRNEDQLLMNKVKKKNLVLTRNINDFAREDETFYLPAEQTANKNEVDNSNLDDTESENKPPEKKMLLDKFNVWSKKENISEQLNMRCKADRAKLNGWDCWECREYYKNLSLSKEELQKRKNQCSRHRYKYERPNTPEGFWDPEFPETLSSTYRTK